MALDVPPAARAWLGDPARPLVVTEGARKADAAVTAGMCCLAVLGVWNWRGRNEHGGVTALPDWEAVALKRRTVYLAFDSDAMTKPEVFDALKLRAFLAGRGADVRVIYLRRTAPAAPSGGSTTTSPPGTGPTTCWPWPPTICARRPARRTTPRPRGRTSSREPHLPPPGPRGRRDPDAPRQLRRPHRRGGGRRRRRRRAARAGRRRHARRRDRAAVGDRAVGAV